MQKPNQPDLEEWFNDTSQPDENSSTPNSSVAFDTDPDSGVATSKRLKIAGKGRENGRAIPRLDEFWDRVPEQRNYGK